MSRDRPRVEPVISATNRVREKRRNAVAQNRAFRVGDCGDRLYRVACRGHLAPRHGAGAFDGRDRFPDMAGRLVWAEGEALPFADATFDAVFTVGGFNYFRDHVAALREMRRVAVPGRPVLVASSDRAVADSVLRRGAYPVPSAVLLARLVRN